MSAEMHLKAGGSATAPYDTWAKSLTTIAGAIAALSAGDLLDITSSYAESAAGMTLAFPGSSTAITQLRSGTEGATSGLTALSTSGAATIESTNATFSVAGTFRAEGIHWKSSGAGISTFPTFAGTSGNQQYHRRCLFDLASTGTGSSWTFGSTSSGASTAVIADESVFKFGNAAHRLLIAGMMGIRGGSIDAGGTAPSGLFTIANGNRPCVLRVSDFDASAMTSSGNIITSITQSGAFAEFRRWKMPSSWTGGVVASGQLKRGDRFKLVDYSSGATNFKLLLEDYAGTQRDETTVKVTGSSESYKITTNTDCSIAAPFRSEEIYIPLTTSATSITLPVCTDGVTLTDAEAFIEVSFFAGTTLLGTISNDGASVIATPANQTSDVTTAWTTTGLASPIKQELTVSVTAGAASHAIARLVVPKPSTTMYMANEPRVV